MFRLSEIFKIVFLMKQFFFHTLCCLKCYQAETKFTPRAHHRLLGQTSFCYPSLPLPSGHGSNTSLRKLTEPLFDVCSFLTGLAFAGRATSLSDVLATLSDCGDCNPKKGASQSLWAKTLELAFFCYFVSFDNYPRCPMSQLFQLVSHKYDQEIKS